MYPVSQSTHKKSPPRSTVSFSGTRGVLWLRTVVYWVVFADVSLVIGITRAFGLNDVVLDAESVKKRIEEEISNTRK